MSPFKSTPGQAYRPSNGSEFSSFESAYCRRCTKDLHHPHGDSGGCPLIVRAMALGVEEEGYPQEWIHGPDGWPTCTAFDPIEDDGEDEPEPPAPQIIDLMQVLKESLAEEMMMREAEASAGMAIDQDKARSALPKEE